MYKHRTEQIPVQEEKNKSRWSLPAALAAGALVLSACGAHEDTGAQNPNGVQHEADHSDEIKIVTDINYQFEHDFGPGELPWLTPEEVEALQENPNAAIRAVTEYVTYTLEESGEIGLDVANGDLEMSGDEIDDVLGGRTDGTLFNSLPTDNGGDESIIADAGAAAFLTGWVSQEKTALCASDGFSEVAGVDCSSSDEDPYTVFGPDGTRLVLVTHSPEDDPGDYTTKRTEESENVIQIIDIDGEQHLKFAPIIEGEDAIVLSEGQSVGADTPEKPDQPATDESVSTPEGTGKIRTDVGYEFKHPIEKGKLPVLTTAEVKASQENPLALFREVTRYIDNLVVEANEYGLSIQGDSAKIAAIESGLTDNPHLFSMPARPLDHDGPSDIGMLVALNSAERGYEYRACSPQTLNGIVGKACWADYYATQFDEDGSVIVLMEGNKDESKNIERSYHLDGWVVYVTKTGMGSWQVGFGVPEPGAVIIASEITEFTGQAEQ